MLFKEELSDSDPEDSSMQVDGSPTHKYAFIDSCYSIPKFILTH